MFRSATVKDDSVGSSEDIGIGRAVDADLDLSAQPASISVDHWLLREAELYKPVSFTAKPVSLFPEHMDLSRQEKVAERERLLAVWAYLVQRHGEDKVLADPNLRRSCTQALDALFARHHSEVKREVQLFNRLDALRDRLDEVSDKQE